MKLRNHTIVNVINTLTKYIESKLPRKIKYAIAKNLGKYNKEYQFYEKQLKELFDEYGEKDADGNVIMNENNIPKVCTENASTFEKELSDLLNIEIEMDNLHFIDEDDLYFDDSDRFDVLTVREITELEQILCKPE